MIPIDGLCRTFISISGSCSLAGFSTSCHQNISTLAVPCFGKLVIQLPKLGSFLWFSCNIVCIITENIHVLCSLCNFDFTKWTSYYWISPPTEKCGGSGGIMFYTHSQVGWSVLEKICTNLMGYHLKHWYLNPIIKRVLYLSLL